MHLRSQPGSMLAPSPGGLARVLNLHPGRVLPNQHSPSASVRFCWPPPQDPRLSQRQPNHTHLAPPGLLLSFFGSLRIWTVPASSYQAQHTTMAEGIWGPDLHIADLLG